MDKIARKAQVAERRGADELARVKKTALAGKECSDRQSMRKMAAKKKSAEGPW